MKNSRHFKSSMILGFGFYLLVSFCFTGQALALSDADKAAIGTEITTIYRAARGVVAKSQKLINDASKGDKGLSADVVIAKTKENYKKATGNDFKMADAGSLKGKTQKALIDSIKEVMNNAQPLINEKGKGLKGFLPAIFAKQMGDGFNKNIGGQAYIKLTAPPKTTFVIALIVRINGRPMSSRANLKMQVTKRTRFSLKMRNIKVKMRFD